MGLFAAAAAKKSAVESKSKKCTNWVVGDPDGSAVALSLKELVSISNQMKALEAKLSIHKNIVLKNAKSNFIRDFAANGVMPQSPMKVVNADGDSCTFVVQDRSGQYGLKEDQVDSLNGLLGDDLVGELVYDETTIKFNRGVMALPGVSEVVERALESAIGELVENELLPADVAGDLVEVDVKRALKPGTVDRAASIVGNNQVKLGAFLDAVGSSCVQYIKV